MEQKSINYYFSISKLTRTQRDICQIKIPVLNFNLKSAIHKSAVTKLLVSSVKAEITDQILP